MNLRDGNTGGPFRRLAAGIPRSRPDLRPAFASLREPALRSWFVSQVLSSSGSMTQGVATAWLVLTLSGSGVDVGLMTTCSFLPILVLGPVIGQLVDHVGPRRVLITTQSLFILLSSLTAVLAGTGAVRVWMLFLIAAATGMVNAPDSAARQVYVVELAGTERVASAITLNEIVLNLSRVLGPSLGALVLGTEGVAACCVLNALSFLMPLAVVFRHKPGAGNGTATAAPRGGSRVVGLRYAWRNPAIRACLVLAAASGMLFSTNVPVSLLATRVFHLGSVGFGLMMAIFGIGAIPGALLAASGPSEPKGRTIALLGGCAGLATVATAHAPDTALVFIGMAATGCLSIWFIAKANTLVMLEADPAMRGQVSAAWNMALPGCEPLTSPFVGWVAGSTGPREGLGAAGLALLLAAVAGWRPLTRPRPRRHHPITVPMAVHHPIPGT